MAWKPGECRYLFAAELGNQEKCEKLAQEKHITNKKLLKSMNRRDLTEMHGAGYEHNPN